MNTHTYHWHGRGPDARIAPGPVDPEGCCKAWREARRHPTTADLLAAITTRRKDDARRRLAGLLGGAA